ncbi:hypothetical protein NIES4071_49720 [Calothrix sp. NIES-4071]|nr:hypothetical protein NIES4071_49720 [Calothrix sp. NIES-4071]BAZ59279.1 hypothetical protein NIES4105_49660 [Calothrix sp. NIES-4105]
MPANTAYITFILMKTEQIFRGDVNTNNVGTENLTP